MHKLIFQNPVGLVSANFSTVRLGDEWGKRMQDGTDLNIYLADSAGTSHGTAEVQDHWTGPMVLAPAILLEPHHDPVCRTWSGLAQVLNATAPEGEVADFNTIITVLRLKHTGSIIKLQ